MSDEVQLAVFTRTASEESYTFSGSGWQTVSEIKFGLDHYPEGGATAFITPILFSERTVNAADAAGADHIQLQDMEAGEGYQMFVTMAD
mmetsp:Transcript_91836/g.163452  ORF Transcript_91836/g.163452 Transcript_91836/m.163452 type:complete len:89 (+) Transcript_91836:99-365(+)|eukprot:CAMPEP_0197653948 /NCGR_PEP_ID=MMETSP1338-20131121/37889_1 /TAXON_ID=43686 ORGANISM="Pelagodinium beii, Strain RCC1491" /NCGR_SAMPLE_ID=MMETSP1338 /ASSEMBLY_ACC=CAM_ASM_000754 /LENGTH=88 /DNA_ID=CAMNT_0043229267 /DNA_START=99 /DNA_END=365 /DNA_ORIENTATION=+